ncbi:hypothetical protein JKP88DRAFT_354403 [Tribonema minus]|uniref:C2H2-type domain-containing protein n=1 Tax=Tribonema minus TaxID=303371 RepID=A0A835Z944_9STRA|nr:hypothetical protein JKP88DRAFT_354403 [Tribonema minus]
MCNLERLAAVVDCILERHELVHRRSGSVVEGVKQELRQVATQTQTRGQDAPILPPQLRQHVTYNALTRTAGLAAQLVRLQNLKEAQEAEDEAKQQDRAAAQPGREEWRQMRGPLHGGDEEGKEAARKAKQQEHEIAQQQNKERRQKRVLPQRADSVEHEAVIETARLRIRGTASMSPNKERYKRPRKRAHEVDRKYTCAHCHRGYGNASSLHLHVRLKHPHGAAAPTGGKGEEREEHNGGGEGWRKGMMEGASKSIRGLGAAPNEAAAAAAAAAALAAMAPVAPAVAAAAPVAGAGQGSGSLCGCNSVSGGSAGGDYREWRRQRWWQASCSGGGGGT